MPKIIIVSNRLPVSVSYSNDGYEISPSIGGLATGLKGIHEKEDSIWIGWSGIINDDAQKQDLAGVAKELKKDYKCITIDYSREELEDFYYGFSNSTIWPLFHYFHDMAHYNDSHYQMYHHVNMKFVTEIEKHLKGDETVWIHDYQLMLLPQMLRKKHPDLKIGFFLHIPFPSYEIFRLLPWRVELL